jgi:hypothetical protein
MGERHDAVSRWSERGFVWWDLGKIWIEGLTSMRVRISFSAWYCLILISRRRAGSVMVAAFFPCSSCSDLDTISYSSKSDTNFVNPCYPRCRNISSKIGRASTT